MTRVDVIESLERRTYFSPLEFSAPVHFSAGSHPSDLVSADLTGNGISDIITSDFSSATIAVMRGVGNGTFRPPVLYAVGNAPEALEVGDFNHDGFPDIVTANEGSNTISVLMNNRDGTFAPAVTYGVGNQPESLAVADLTGNGNLDIVTADEGSSTVSVLMNTGIGTFDAPESYFTGAQPDGIAIADLNGDSLPDIVTVNPVNNNLHVLLNLADGTFGKLETYTTGLAARAVTIADVNSDGRPDIITSNLHDTTISLLEGIGNGTFQSQQTFGTGVFPFSVTVADLNGDGRPDIVTANNFDNAVGVLLHNANGSFSPTRSFHAGTGPTATVAVDINGDGKPDLISSDFNTSTITVLVNQTVFVPLIATTTTLTPGQNPVEVNNRLELSVQITPATMEKFHPVGVVQFFDGDKVLGVSTISATGVAHIFTSGLIVGTHSITAHYGGDGTYAGSLSSAVLEVVQTPAEVTPLLAVTIPSVKLPPAYVAGDRGVVNLAIEDIGAGPASGTVLVSLYASLNTTFDSTAFPVAIDGSTQVAIKLVGGRTRKVGVSFTVPANLLAATYTFFAALAPGTNFTAAQVDSTPAIGLTTAKSVLAFGAVGTHRGYRLTQTLANGTSVTVGMTGPGTGVLTQDSSGGISLVLANTSPNSTLTITSAGVTLDSLMDPAAMGTVTAPTTTVDGAISLAGSVRKLTLAGATNSNIFLGGGVSNILSLGTMVSTSMFSAAAIRSLAVNSWTDTPTDTITTAWIITLTSAGDFGASLTINGGTGRKDLGLTTVDIGGALENSTWSVLANVGAVHVAGVDAGWSGSIHGTFTQLIDTADFAGNLAALGIGLVQISGDLTSADLLAGAEFGGDARLGNGDDVFTSGIFTSLVVDGGVTSAVVAAGLSPVGANLLGPGTVLLKKSAIRAVTVSGSVDATSRFLAMALPAQVTIDGIAASPLDNPVFVT